jgi:hypothetical protein
MVDNLDLAGVIGTWVAVGFAVVALVGIVGPILVWRKTTSERYKAITAVRDVDNVFISRGFPISPNVRLFRTVKVPKLDESIIAKTAREVWRLNHIENIGIHCGWAKLCQLINAYNVTGDVKQRYPTGDALVVRSNETLLPLHRHWILVLGILGRFGNREVQGKVVSRGSVVPGRHILTAALDEGVEDPKTRKRYIMALDLSRGGDVRMSRRTREARYLVVKPSLLQNIIYGITGSFSLPSPRSLPYPRSPQEANDIEKAQDIEELRFVLYHQETGMISQPDELPLIKLFWLAIGCLPDFKERIFCLDDPPYIPSPRSRGPNSEPLLLKFEWVPRWSKPVLDIAEALGGVSNQLFALHITHLGPNTSLSDIQASPDWTNTGEVTHTEPIRPIFVFRLDVQRLACSLLAMDWSSQSYLVGRSQSHLVKGNRSSICMILLTEAESCLDDILKLMVDNYEYLSVANDDNLWPLMRKAQDRESTPGYNQTSAGDLYTLDSTLRKIRKESSLHERSHMVIAALVITNTEFRYRVFTAAEAMVDFAAFPIQFDISNGRLTLSSLGVGEPGFVADFEGDMEPVTITGTTILLAALWGCVRSSMLYDTPDSEALFRFFRQLKEVVNIC